MPPLTDNSNHAAEYWSSRILRVGVWTSACLMIAGLIFAAIVPSAFVPLSSNPSLGLLAERMLSLSMDPATLMYAGLVVLMFTPILRVITALFAFAIERDLRFVVVSSIVLLLLVGEIVYSVFIKQ